MIDDLSSGKPTDRLICGDVGFGKTEVALKAVEYLKKIEIFQKFPNDRERCRVIRNGVQEVVWGGFSAARASFGAFVVGVEGP